MNIIDAHGEMPLFLPKNKNQCFGKQILKIFVLPLKNDSLSIGALGNSEVLLGQKSYCGLGARDFFSKICFP